MYTPVIEDEAEGLEDMGSFNHGYVQARLIVGLDKLSAYTPVTEVSLDVSKVDLGQFDLRTKEEIKPDICLYPKRGLSRPRDILKMTEMPVLAIEILSPRQGTYEILEKFRLYFELGVRSCWLVEPALSTVTVYSSSTEWKTFAEGDVVDDTLGIHLALQELFQ